MKIVKLTFNYDWPLFRQTPNNDGIWGNYKFIIDNNLKECDFWFIYGEHELKTEKVKCKKENVYFIPGESKRTSPKFSQKFLNQFGGIITMQTHLKHRNIIYNHNANPWFVGKSYAELVQLKLPPLKSKLISVVSSNKAFTKGHLKRLEFVGKLKAHFGDKLDVFGRGIIDFEDKWDVLADYKYTIAIENDNVNFWVTEKFFDCLYSFTYPFYFGCPNLETFVDDQTFSRIDIENVEDSIRVIENAISNNLYEQRIESIKNQRLLSLNTDNLFPFLVSIIESEKKMFSKKQYTIIKSQKEIRPFFSNTYRIIKTLYNHILK